MELLLDSLSEGLLLELLLALDSLSDGLGLELLLALDSLSDALLSDGLLFELFWRPRGIPC